LMWNKVGFSGLDPLYEFVEEIEVKYELYEALQGREESLVGYEIALPHFFWALLCLAISSSTGLRSTWFQKQFFSPWSYLQLSRRHRLEITIVVAARRPRSRTARAGNRLPSPPWFSQLRPL
jgi:hypothetical protein